jgi:acyl-coenzyme A synthetase/AMP-(fatty) acid ligase
MAQGYEGEERSAQFEDGWFYPGDLAVLRADGWLIVTGRNTDVINLGGKKLSAVEMESRLQNLDNVEDVCVMNVDIRGKESLAVAVVCPLDADRSALRQQVVDALGRVGPLHLVFMDRLPRNAMGKLPRQAIAQHLSKTLTDRANPRSNDVASGKAA